MSDDSHLTDINIKLRRIEKLSGVKWRRKYNTYVYEISLDDYKTITELTFTYHFKMIQFILNIESCYVSFLLKLLGDENE